MGIDKFVRLFFLLNFISTNHFLMKILHTSDWHLGQLFLSNDRLEEHRLALDWLLETIKEEKIEVLIIAGDIYDTYSPPNYAKKLYYEFLINLRQTICKNTVVVGGNHDLPAMLNTTKEILGVLNVYVVAEAEENIEDQLIEIKEGEDLLCVVAAVPFLRDKDIRKSLPGQSSMDRSTQIKEGIFNHYQSLAGLAQEYVDKNVPIIGTGHLYAKGAVASDKQDNIYLGNIENIEAKQFPEVFDYIALGHIHRPQNVSEDEKVRYCGSIIPLSFSETKDEKSVTILEYEGKVLKEKKIVPLPIFRRLKTIEGTFETVKKRLTAFAEKERHLTPWVEIIVDLEGEIPNLNGQIQDFVKDFDMVILRVRTRKQQTGLGEQIEEQELQNMDVEEVFKQKCGSTGKMPENMEDLLLTFRELKENYEDILAKE